MSNVEADALSLPEYVAAKASPLRLVGLSLILGYTRGLLLTNTWAELVTVSPEANTAWSTSIS